MRILATFGLILFCSCGRVNAEMVLVENHKSNVSIKIDKDATSCIRFAVSEMLKAFMLSCNIKPTINPTVKTQYTIYIHSIKDTKLFKKKPIEQAYFIKTRADVIEICGYNPQAAMWGVFDFCRRILEVEWPVPGQIRLRGAKKNTLSIKKLNISEAPVMEIRGWFYGQKFLDWIAENRQNTIGVLGYHYPSYKTRCKRKGILLNINMHSFAWQVSYDKYYQEHPEYFALINGKRYLPKKEAKSLVPNPCTSNNDLINILIDKAKKFFKENPETKIYPIVPNDDKRWCECGNCQKLDGNQKGKKIYSNRLFYLVNKVAKGIAKEFPNRYIGTLAYSNFIDPPEINIEPNVAIGFCPIERDYGRRIDDPNSSKNVYYFSLLKKWLKKVKYLYIWDYYGYYQLTKCVPPISRIMTEDFPVLQALGVKGSLSEIAYNKTDILNLPAYVYARISWDTSLSYEQILQDYCQAMYGKAAKTMIQYHKLYEKSILEVAGRIGYPGTFQGKIGKIKPLRWEKLHGLLITAKNIVIKSKDKPSIQAVSKDIKMLDSMYKRSLDPRNIKGIGANILYNPNVEMKKARGWGHDIRKGNYKFALSTAEAHAGKQSLQITCVGKKGWARWLQPKIRVKKGEKYALSVWAKGTGGRVVLWQGKLSTWKVAQWTGGDDKWHRIVIPEIKALSSEILLLLETKHKGSVYYDDAFFAKLPTAK